MMSKKLLTLWFFVGVMLASSVELLAGDTRILHADDVQLDSGAYHTNLSAGTLTGNTTFTLPADNGTSNYVLATDGAGTLSWLSAITLLPRATSSVNGYLASTDWSTFNGKVSTSESISTTSPLSGGGDLSAPRTLSISQAATAANGYLSSTDWNTFNGKQPAGNYITALTGDISASGPGSVVATLATVTVGKGGTGLTAGTSGGVLAYTASGTLASSGALTANAVVVGGGAGVVPTVVTNNSTGTNKFLTQSSSGVPAWSTLVIGDIPGPAATAANGYLTSTDWNTFNGKVGTATSISTTAPLTGGGDLSANRTFAITQAATAANGYLSSTDWNTFNGKLNTSFSNVSGTLGITNGGSGQITANAALNAFLPVQTSQSGKVLTTNGTDTSWTTSSAGTVTSVAATVPGGFSIGGSPVTSSGTLAIGASGTSGGVLYYSGATTSASSAALGANQVVAGGGAGAAPATGGSTFIVGAGEAATPSAVTFRAPAAAGLNTAGADFTVAASNGTGSGGSGNIIFQTAPIAVSSSSANTFTNVFTVKKDGSVVLGNGDGTATVTNGLLSGAARTGLNAVGSDVYFQASNGTGNVGSGSLIFQTGAPGGSSSTAATLTTALTIDHNSDVILGAGEGGTPSNSSIRGPAGIGTNIPGGNLTISASNGTGTGGSGSIIIRTAPAGSTGTTQNTLATTISIANTGAVTFAKTGGNVAWGCTRRLGSSGAGTSATVSCSAGEIILGGGCEIVSGAGTTTNIQQSYPSSTTAWQCNYQASATIRAYGLCCSQ